MQCLVATVTVSITSRTAFGVWNYNREMGMHNELVAAVGTFTQVSGGCTARLNESYVFEDCYSCSIQCSPKPSCFCEVHSVYELSVNSAAGFETGFVYRSEVLDGSRQATGTCTAEAAPSAETESRDCWYSGDPSANANAWIACGSPGCFKLRNPGLLTAAGPTVETPWIFVAISAALLLLCILVVGPCCCPAMFATCGMTCLMDVDESSEAGTEK